MTRRIRLSRRARADLRSIAEYTTETWGAVQAERYLADLNAAMELLATGRRSGRAAGDIEPNLLSFRSSAHVIYFRATVDTLFIVRVLHGRMDPTTKVF